MNLRQILNKVLPKETEKGEHVNVVNVPQEPVKVFKAAQIIKRKEPIEEFLNE